MEHKSETPTRKRPTPNGKGRQVKGRMTYPWDHIPKATSRFERPPPFEEGVSSSGRWSISRYDGKTGSTVNIKYDGNPISISANGMFYSAFDINLYEGKVTSKAKIGISCINPPYLPARATEEMFRSFAQAHADSTVIKDVLDGYMTANHSSLGLGMDEVRANGNPLGHNEDEDDDSEIVMRPHLPRITHIAHPPRSKPGAGKDDRGSIKKDPIYSIGFQLRSSRRGNNDDSRSHLVDTYIIKDGKSINPITRSELNNLLSGGQYYVYGEGELHAFISSTRGDCYIIIEASLLAFNTMSKTSLLTKDEMKEKTQSITEKMKSLGLSFSPDEPPDPSTPTTSSASTVPTPVRNAEYGENEDEEDEYDEC